MDLSNVNAAGLRDRHSVFLGKRQTQLSAERLSIQKQQGHPKDRKPKAHQRVRNERSERSISSNDSAQNRIAW